MSRSNTNFIRWKSALTVIICALFIVVENLVRVNHWYGRICLSTLYTDVKQTRLIHVHANRNIYRYIYTILFYPVEWTNIKRRKYICIYKSTYTYIFIWYSLNQQKKIVKIKSKITFEFGIKPNVNPSIYILYSIRNKWNLSTCIIIYFLSYLCLRLTIFCTFKTLDTSYQHGMYGRRAFRTRGNGAIILASLSYSGSCPPNLSPLCSVL